MIVFVHELVKMIVFVHELVKMIVFVHELVKMMVFVHELGKKNMARKGEFMLETCCITLHEVFYSSTLSQTSPGFYVSAMQAISPFTTVFSTCL